MTYTILVLKNDGLQTDFASCSGTPDSFFYACNSAIVDSFVVVSLFLRNITFCSIIADE